MIGWPVADHSWWAKSVRWSCGRPGYKALFDWRAAWEKAYREEYARAYVEHFGVLPPASFVRITAVS